MKYLIDGRLVYKHDVIVALSEKIDDPKIDYIKYLKDVPVIDAVEVVRCKDCKWWDGIECQTRDIDVVDVDDFCSYGERKGGEEE